MNRPMICPSAIAGRSHRRRRGLTTLATVTAVAVSVLVIGACGTDDSAGESDETGPPPTATAFEADRYVVSSLQGRDRVPESEIELTFDDGQLSAWAGCNRIFGSYRIEESRLIAGPLASTRMACSDPLMDQDAWLIEFLESEPEVSVQGNVVTISTSGVTMVADAAETLAD